MNARTRPSNPKVEVGSEDVLPGSMIHQDPQEKGIKLVALGIALVIHMAALVVNLPAMRGATSSPPPQHNGPIVVKRYIPPPPEIQQPRRMAKSKKLTRKIPIPDPTPDALEPIQEPAPEIGFYPTLGDDDLLIGEPSPPGAAGAYGPPGEGEPLLAGVGGATIPVRIEESYVKPEYPEIARAARLEGNVVLRAVISCQGTVDEIDVQRCSQPGFGFEKAAIDAVKQWRYEPAKQNDRPVAVFFSIFVEFALV